MLCHVFQVKGKVTNDPCALAQVSSLYQAAPLQKAVAGAFAFAKQLREDPFAIDRDMPETPDVNCCGRVQVAHVLLRLAMKSSIDIFLSERI